MARMTLTELASLLPGQLQGEDGFFERVSTDTRSLLAGDLYIALCGLNFDGHDFVDQAFAKGAAAAVVQREMQAAGATLRVTDTLTALGAIGAANRDRYEGPLVAITGSGGKTTTKNMLASILSGMGQVLFTQGNLNNEIGVPKTLLGLEEKHGYAVVEMGASRAGDIEYLCSLAHPDVSVLLNVMPAHLEGFGSVDGVARAKSEILAGLAGAGVAVFDVDSPYADVFRDAAGTADLLTFSRQGEASVTANDITLGESGGVRFVLSTPVGTSAVKLKLSGDHNVSNALAAAAAAVAVGADIECIVRGLESVVAEPGRMCEHRLATGPVLIDDSYNANPAAVRAAIDVLSKRSGRSVLVLGVMGELGSQSGALHEDVGRYAADNGINELWCVGEAASPAVIGFGDGARSFDALEDLLEEVDHLMRSVDIALVKGSRSAGMDKLVSHLLHEREEHS